METKFVLQILFLNSNLASNIILTMNRKYAFLNAHILSSLLFLFCVNSFLFSQKKEIDARNISTSEFPKVSGSLWIRDPEGIVTKTISFNENDKPIKLNFETFQKSDSVVKNKTILFLVLNTNNKKQQEWYKNVIQLAFENGVVKPGDRIDIVSYSCILDDQIIYPNSLKFTDKVVDLNLKLDAIKQYKNYNNKGRVQTHIALNEALSLLEKEDNVLPTGVFVLSDDKSLSPELVGETPGIRSRRLDIPIYGIIYENGAKPYSIEKVCEQTYGDYFADVTNSELNASKELVNYLDNFQRRHAGLYYPFTYTSTFEKDGKTHEVKIDSKKGQTLFSLAVPSKSIIERIKENPLVSILIFIVLIGLIIVIVMFYKKNKLKQAELEEQRKHEMKEVEEKQKLAEQKLSQQDQEIQRIHQEEKRQQEEEIRKRQAEGQQKDDEAQLQKMLERGNFPWFEYKFGSDSGSYQIQTPRLSVGRDTNNVWTINHPTVSKQHFKLTFRDYVYTLEDLNSTNGTFVNGYKISQTIINHGDCIQIGDITLTIHI